MPAPAPPAIDSCASTPPGISFDAVYYRLKALASRQLGRGARGTLDTTALVHEVYLRLDGGRELSFEHSAQFFAYAARAMRHGSSIPRAAACARRPGGDWIKVTFTANADAQPAIESAEQALALEEALTKLEQTDERAARVVELRYFAGLSPEQVAEVLNVTRRTSTATGATHARSCTRHWNDVLTAALSALLQ
jgi:RNA polymerase sigma factor (TIGR02999 family)